MGTKPHRRPVLIVTISIVVVALAAVGIAALTGVFRHDDDVLTPKQDAAPAAPAPVPGADTQKTQ